MKKILTLLLFLFLAGSVWAAHSSIIGGFRNGLAFGLQVEQKFTDRWEGNFAMETTTGLDMGILGDNPFILFGGLKYYLGSLTKSPASLCFGVIGDYGNRTTYGTYASLTIENLYNDPALFLDLGADFYSGRTNGVVQLGYRLLGEPSEL
jgi:hypothetical protein